LFMPSARLGIGLYGDLEPSPAPASPLRRPTERADFRSIARRRLRQTAATLPRM